MYYEIIVNTEKGKYFVGGIGIFNNLKFITRQANLLYKKGFFKNEFIFSVHISDCDTKKIVRVIDEFGITRY